MKSSSRSKKASINIIFGFVYEGVALVCGLLLPRLIIHSFGSQYNGLISSVSQFISCIALLKAGIGGVAMAALYKPLAENDSQKISEVVAASESYLRKIALIFLGLVAVISVVYPRHINTEFDPLFSSTLIFIISITTFAQYFFGLSYQNLLSAAQLRYVISIIEIITTILNTIISVILINSGCGIHIVKLGSALVFVLNPILIRLYARKRFKIVRVKKPDSTVLAQKWDSVGHAVANFINDNTDIMVLTVLTTLSRVSVYTVYHYVIVNIRKIVNNFVTSFGAAFGDMYAKNEIDLMKKNLRLFETIVFSITTVIYSVTLVMICPFALLYTKNVTDVNYYEPLFGAVLTVAGAFSCFRIPYQSIVLAVGHFKQTRNGAFVEALLNISISIVMVKFYGLVGVAVGTLVAAVFRTIQYASYLGKKVLDVGVWSFFQRLAISLAIFGATYGISLLYPEYHTSVWSWILFATITTAVSTTLVLLTDLLFYRDSLSGIFQKMKRLVKGR